MRETVNRMLAAIKEYLAKMPKGTKIKLVVLALFVIILAVIVVNVLTAPNWIYIADDPSGAIYSALNDMGIQTDVRGTAIYVPEERKGDAEMRLRQQGLLGVTGYDYTILDGALGFGVTTEHLKRILDIDLGERISATVRQNPKIHNAHTTVNSGESSPFRSQTNARKATASVALTLTPGISALTNAEAQAIAEIVRGTVPGIEYENISITDTNNLRHYRVGDGSQDIETEFNQRMALQDRLAAQLEASVEQLISPIYGMSNFSVVANVVLNFDTVVRNIWEYFPPIAGEEQGMLISSEILWEIARNLGDAEGIPGTDSNAMGAIQYPYGTLDNAVEYLSNSERLNFQLNEILTIIEEQRGSIERLSISININSELDVDDYTEELIDLVSKATGSAPGNIAIYHLPFNIDTSWEDEYRAEQAAKEARERTEWIVGLVLRYGTMIMLGIFALMFVKAIIKAFKKPEPEEVLIAAGPGGMDILVDDDDSQAREYEDVDLNAKSAGLEQIERFIDKDAATVAHLLKNWLSDE
ncbi:MAG: hypothetical protein FWH17_01625 [Oscillospiraceae bacterium]|nr:hypothetical protein [Oscillospiraceae bacterium]